MSIGAGDFRVHVLPPQNVLGPLNDVELVHAPDVLFCAGDVGLLQRGPRIAVIGSRAASAPGLRRAGVLARAMVRHDVVVLSGLARGIDTAAHEAALAAGGRTIAILGTPLDQIYPPENALLQARLAREQLLVSQFAIGSKGGRERFVLRNRTMALLSDAVIVVEAGEMSGTRYVAWEALRLGRPVFLLESLAHHRALTWPAKLMHYGAQVLTRGNLDRCLAETPAVTTARLDLGLAPF